jgi:hypothetical protein
MTSSLDKVKVMALEVSFVSVTSSQFYLDQIGFGETGYLLPLALPVRTVLANHMFVRPSAAAASH